MDPSRTTRTGASRRSPRRWFPEGLASLLVFSFVLASATAQEGPLLIDPSGPKTLKGGQIQRVIFLEEGNSAASGAVMPAHFFEIILPGVSDQQEICSVVPSPIRMDGEDPDRITLALALRLAGANNLQIEIARQRVAEAIARSMAADFLWVPSLRFGAGYNRHEGRIQDTRGSVIQVNRDSVFLGGGAGMGSSSLTGASGGPARLVVDLSLADAIFERFHARQMVQVHDAGAEATFNDTLLEVATEFVQLSESHAHLLATQQDVENAMQLVKTTEDFLTQRMVPRSDVARARSELAVQKRRRIEAQERVIISSAAIVRLLRLQLEPTTVLEPFPAEPIPIELVDRALPLEALLAQGLSTRPELVRYQALVQASLDRLDQEKWRPWLPHLVAGVSGVGFGGGPVGNFGDLGGRVDFDAQAVWEWKNFGVGNLARLEERRSQHYQAHLRAESMRDKVTEEIVRAFHLTPERLSRIETTRQNIIEANQSLTMNLERIQGGEGLPIEVIQAIQAVASANEAYIRAVSDHNRAQLQLVRAIGEPIQVEPDDKAE